MLHDFFYCNPGECLLARSSQPLSNKALSICFWFLSKAKLLDIFLFFLFLTFVRQFTIRTMWKETTSCKRHIATTTCCKRNVYVKCKDDLIWLNRFQGVSNANAIHRLRNLANAQWSQSHCHLSYWRFACRIFANLHFYIIELFTSLMTLIFQNWRHFWTRITQREREREKARGNTFGGICIHVRCWHRNFSVLPIELKLCCYRWFPHLVQCSPEFGVFRDFICFQHHQNATNRCFFFVAPTSIHVLSAKVASFRQMLKLWVYKCNP